MATKRLSVEQIVEEARIIRDSTGAKHGIREQPNVSAFKRLCEENGIADWRVALLGEPEA